jgi:hypothetical protein
MQMGLMNEYLAGYGSGATRLWARLDTPTLCVYAYTFIIV